jgi:hypothetical protein
VDLKERGNKRKEYWGGVGWGKGSVIIHAYAYIRVIL